MASRNFTITQDGSSRTFSIETGVGPPGTTLWSGLTGTTNHVPFDTTPTDVPTTIGTLSWNADDACLEYAVNGGTISVGKETFDYYTNLSGVPMVDGDIVSIVGASGNRTAVDLTDATDDISAANVIGMVTNGAANNQTVRVTKSGSVHSLNTNGITEGATIYVDPNNPGKWTTTKPSSPNHVVSIGFVQVAHSTNGVVDVVPNHQCVTASLITDSSTAGRAMLTAADADDQRAFMVAQKIISGPYATEDAALFDGVLEGEPYLKTGGDLKWVVPFVPDSVAGLQLWLDPSALALSNGANVTSVADLSGNSRTATPIGTAPTFETAGPNSQKWIVCNNTGLTTPSFSAFPSKRGTWFFVYRPTTTPATWLRVFGTNSGGTGQTWVWGTNSNSGTAELFWGASFTTPPKRLMWDKGGDAVIMCIRQDSNTNCSVFRGGSKVSDIALSDLQTDSNPLKIGQALVGRIGEVFGYDTALTDSQCFAALAYLSRKWGASGKVPVNMTFEGDSQTYGSGLGSNTNLRIVEDSTWPHKLITEIGAPQHVTYHNLAVGGSRWQELAARAAETDERLNPRAINVLFAWAGTNDAYLNNATATHAEQQAYCLARKAAGWDIVVVGTAMDRIDQDPAGWRSSYNTLTRNNWSTYADGLIDVGGHPILGADEAYNNATYFNQTDKVHLNAAGWQIVAEMAADVISPLIDL